MRGLAAALACVAAVGSCTRPILPPKYVILVSLDTLRADRLSVYGYNRVTDPTLSALADESVVFENAGAQAAQTLLSHKSLFTAKYPLTLINEKTGADLATLLEIPDKEINGFVNDALIRTEGPSLVASLREAGYATAGFADGGWMHEAFGFAEGFAHYEQEGGGLASSLDRVERWISDREDSPFFLFLHTYDIHAPYWTRAPYNNEYCFDHQPHLDLRPMVGRWMFAKRTLSAADVKGIRDHYDAGIRSADAWLGSFFERLRVLGVYDESLIVVTSDHGESLAEHDLVGHGALELQTLRVPLIIKFPRAAGIAPRRVARPVELVDVMPTLLEACGVEVPQGVDGRTLLTAARGLGSRNARSYAVAQISYKKLPKLITRPGERAVWEPGRWFVVHDAHTDTFRAYDLRTDPSAARDVASQRVPGVEPLLEHLASLDARLTAADLTAPRAVEIDDATSRRLAALGYLE